MEILSTQAVWDNVDVEKEVTNSVISTSDGETVYSLIAENYSDGDIVVETHVYTPTFKSRKSVLIVSEYGRSVQKDLILDLVKKGYNVVVPDYDGAGGGKTSFPNSREFGHYTKAGRYLTSIVTTARETCPFLYAFIFRRVLTFMQSIGLNDVVLMGVRTGVDVAVQVAGTDKRLVALVCVCGACYTEYLGIPKYGAGLIEKKELLAEERVAWLSEVSSLAYARNVKVPSAFFLGTNGAQSDIDRMPNLIGLMSHSSVRVFVSHGTPDNIDGHTYAQLLKYLNMVFVRSYPPELPVMLVKVNSEAQVYAHVTVDDTIAVQRVVIYYGLRDNNHRSRYWRQMEAETAGKDEYIAKLRIDDGKALLFSYCEVSYLNGIKLCSVINCLDLSKYDEVMTSYIYNPIVYQKGLNGKLLEYTDDAVILDSKIKETTLPNGLKGMAADCKLVVYLLPPDDGTERLLCIDCYSEDDEYLLKLRVGTFIDGQIVEYHYKKPIITIDGYTEIILRPTDFKTDKFLPLQSWKGIFGLLVDCTNVAIGKILFI